MLPKLLGNNEDFEDTQHMAIDFDKILQSLVLTMEHPDPFVRKVAMYWMTRIIQAHISPILKRDEIMGMESVKDINGTSPGGKRLSNTHLTAASISVRNSLQHLLPGILLRCVDGGTICFVFVLFPNVCCKMLLVSVILTNQELRILFSQTIRHTHLPNKLTPAFRMQSDEMVKPLYLIWAVLL